MPVTMSKYDFLNKRVLIRVDFNVPLNENLEVTDDTRIKLAIPTIQKVIKCGGKVILMSHMGRPIGIRNEKLSLKHIIGSISMHLKKNILFVNDCIGSSVEKAVNNMQNGEVLLLENLRFYKEETAGDIAFAKELSKLGDVYINDAFGTAHRAHASTAVIAQFFPESKMFGLLMDNEIQHIEKAINHAKRPITAIVGGAKISSKINILKRLIDKVDNIIIGGGMSFTFIKATGGHIGASLVENDKLDMAKQILEIAIQKGIQVFIPQDAVVADSFSQEANTKTMSASDISENWMGLDIGEETTCQFKEVIKKSATIIWNGPMGVFEMDKFQNGTVEIAKAVAEASQNGAYSLVGGGDSVAAVNKFNLADQVSYISTGGGALLEYLEGIELPGIKAILN